MDNFVREEQVVDIESIFSLNAIAFETDAEARLVDNLRASGSLTLSLVAEIDGKIVGHIAFSPMKIDGFRDLKLIGLAPMSVHPSLQRQGIGSKLVMEGIERLRKSGVDAIFLLGHKEYYPRFGFVPSLSSFGIKSKYDVPDEVFMAMELNPGGLNGAEGVVEYCREFDEL